MISGLGFISLTGFSFYKPRPPFLFGSKATKNKAEHIYIPLCDLIKGLSSNPKRPKPRSGLGKAQPALTFGGLRFLIFLGTGQYDRS